MKREAKARARSQGSGVAAVRGAVQVAANNAADIREATARLLIALLEANRLEPAQIVSAVFTATPDLDADFPAHAARRLGWTEVPLLGAREMGVPGALPRVVRVLLTVQGVRSGARLKPVYLEGAAALRPDLAAAGSPAARRGATPARARAAQANDAPVAIVGLGQIGGSIGLALGRRPGWRRIGWDRSRAARRDALAAGAVDEIAPSLDAACRGAALAVLATPVDTLPAVIERAAAVLPRGAALLDTGSARGALAPALAQAAARGVRAVGGHPIAGSEGRGIAAARADLFAGSTFALLPACGAVPAVVRALVRDLGARALTVTAADHDRALARTSHLPYLVSRALATVGGAAARRGLSGPGFRGMTRLAASDPRVALAYCRANGREIAAAWRALEAAIAREVKGLGKNR
ncbi:MAG TPA: chorismate mutase [Candidatus Eisenbacteria bacterium]|jgi:monofunctional chorismate mutase